MIKRNKRKSNKQPYLQIHIAYGLLFLFIAYFVNANYTVEEKIISPLPENFIPVVRAVEYIEVTPIPTNTPTPSVVKNKAVYNVVSATAEQVKDEIKKYSWPHDQAIAIAQCESNFRGNAVGDIGLPDGGPASYGVFQIRAYHNRPSPELLLDYRINIKAAYEIWKVQGWGPWTCKKVL